METNRTESAEMDDLISSVKGKNNTNSQNIQENQGPSENDQEYPMNSNSIPEENVKEANTGISESVSCQRKEGLKMLTETQKKLATTLTLTAEEKAKQMEDSYNALGLKRCGNCPFTTSDEILYNNHSSICTKKQSQKDSVSLHQDGQILLNFCDQTYTCKTCNLTWINKAEFYEHVVCHISNDPYVCMTCRQNFSSRVLIEQHAKHAHPNGDSRCGLRGIKKGKQFVEELEKNGSLTLFGKITIPKTPRNQSSKGQSPIIAKPIALSGESFISAAPAVLIQTVSNTENTNPVASTITNDKKITNTPLLPKSTIANGNYLSPSLTALQCGDSSKIGSSYPDLRNLASKVRPILQKLQEKMTPGSSISIATLSQPVKGKDIGMKITTSTALSSANHNLPAKEVTPLFGVVNKETGHLEPATIPSRIQTIVPGQTSQSLLQDHTIKNPQYQVKDITEYTTTPSIVTSTATSVISTTPVYLIPIGPVVHQKQPNNNLMIGNIPVSNPLPQMNQNSISTNPQKVLVQNSTNTRNDQTGSQVILTPTMNPNIPQQQVPILIPNQQNQLYFVNQPIALPKNNPNPPLIAGNVTNSPTVTPQTTKMIYIPSCSLPSTTKPNILTNKASQNSLSTRNLIDKPVSLNQPYCSRSTSGNINSIIEVTSGTTKMIYTPSTSQKDCLPQDVPSSSQMIPPMKNIPSISQNDFSTISLNSKAKPTSVSGGSFIPVCPTTEPPSYKETILGKARETDDCTQTISTPGTRYLFRIKPGNGFVCEACRKFTKDECTFRNHIWNHFHIDQKACQSCTHEYVAKRQVGRCVLVNSIVCNLIKRSALEYKKMMAMLTSNEIIDISDDEEEKLKEKDDKESGTEVIVLEDDDDNNLSGLQIRITSTSTISEEDYKTAGKKENKALAEIIEKENGDTSVEKQTQNEPKEIDCVGEKTETEPDCVGEKTETEPKERNDVEKQSKNKTKSFDREHLSKSEDMSNTPSSSGNSLLEYQLNKNDGKSKEVKSHDLPKEMAIVSVQQHLVSQTPKSNETDRTNNCSVTKESNMVNICKKKNVEISQTHDESTQEESNSNMDAYDLAENQILAGEHSSAFYMCGYEHCSFTSFKLMKYKIHLRENHMNEYNFVCSHCGMKDYYEESHIRHLHSHASSKSFALFSCPVRMCSYKSNLLHYYTCHLNAHKTDELNIRCVYCNKTFQTTEKLQRHLKENILKFVNCNYCSFKFEKRRVVLDHIRNMHRDRIRMVTVTSQIVCLEREINFYNPPPAKAVVSQEDDVGKSMESINIPAILEQVQKESAPKLKSDTVAKEAVTKEAVTKDVSKVIEHSKEDGSPPKQPKCEVKGKKSKAKNAGPKSLMCLHCNYLSYNMALYTRHVSLHDEEPDRTKRFVCNLCPYSIDTYSSFKKHSMNHVGRSEIKTFDCTLCTFSTNLKSLIMDHLQENHDGAGYYTITTEVVISTESSCRFCNFKARHADQVNLHEKLAHIDSDDTEQDANAVAESSKHETNSSAKVVIKESTKRLKYHCEYCSVEFKHKAQLFSHIQEGHDDIQEKKFTFYKCKYCSLGSTRKEMIVSHIDKEHTGKDIRILRKIEIVEKKSEKNNSSSAQNESMNSDNDSSSAVEVVIPDGNVFKSQFRCPKCSFTTMVRINAIRHIKEHPNLKPIREKDNGFKKTARKSTSKPSSIQPQDKSPGKSHCSLIQNTELKENPFTAVKEAVDKLKQSEKSQKDTYVLGDDDLHDHLSTCFIPIEKDMKFKCKICKQSIIKKFVLHRHVLEHLDVVFFKCKYCSEGTVEKSLLFGHIQKSHPQQPLLYHQLGRNEVDVIIKERLMKLSLGSIGEKSDNSDHLLPNEKMDVERPSSSYTETKDGNMQNFKPIKDKEITKSAAKYKCTYPNCRYTSRLPSVMEWHLLHHGNKSKNFKCSLCDYRQSRYETLKHIYKQHKGLSSAKAVKIEDLDVDELMSDNSEIKSSRESSVDSLSSVMSLKDGKFVKNSKGKKIKVDSLTVSKTGNVFEMRKMFKCKECGLKKASVSSMYKHFSTTKCKRPPYQCSYCSFQRYTKKDILTHAKIRHPGKKLDLAPLPLSFKMAKLKIPIKQAFEGEDVQSQENKEISKKSKDSKVLDSPSLTPQFDAKENVTCGLCSSFKCDSVMKLQHHINTIHDGMLLHCLQCSYKTPLIKHMLNHCTHVHLQKQAKYRTLAERTKQGEESLTVKGPERLSEISFPCVKCEMTYSDTNRIRYHYFTHLEYKPNVCVHCGQGFQRLFSLQRHSKEKHQNKPIKYKYVKDIQKETKVDKWIEKTKRRRSELIRVRLEGSASKLGKKRALESESDSEHAKKKSKKMQNVMETVLDEVTLESEKTSPMKYRVCLDENGKRIFKCCHCSFTAGDNKTLRQHLSSHGTRLFKCCYCSFSSKIRSKAYSHCKTSHNDQEVKVLDRKTNRILTEHQSENVATGSNDFSNHQTGRILRYICCICHKKVEGMEDFRKHLERHTAFQTSRVDFNPRVILNHVSPKLTFEKGSKDKKSERDIEHAGDEAKKNVIENLKYGSDSTACSIHQEVTEVSNIDCVSQTKGVENMEVKDSLLESKKSQDDPTVSNFVENRVRCDEIGPNESTAASDIEKRHVHEKDLVEQSNEKNRNHSYLEGNECLRNENENNDFDDIGTDPSEKLKVKHDGGKDVEQMVYETGEKKSNSDIKKMHEIEKGLSKKMQEIENDLINVENSLLGLKKDKNSDGEIISKKKVNIGESEHSENRERSEEKNSDLDFSAIDKSAAQKQDECDTSRASEPPDSDAGVIGSTG